MSFLGVHFSLSEEEVQQLCRFEIECDRIEYLQEVIEPDCFESQPERKVESDQAWNVIHQVLSGSAGFNSGSYPLCHLILGGESLSSDPDYILSLKTPEQVKAVALALAAITRAEFRARYFSIAPTTCDFQLSEENLAYTWEWFGEVRKFWLLAADEGRYVLFTASL